MTTIDPTMIEIPDVIRRIEAEGADVLDQEIAEGLEREITNVEQVVIEGIAEIILPVDEILTELIEEIITTDTMIDATIDVQITLILTKTTITLRAMTKINIKEMIT